MGQNVGPNHFHIQQFRLYVRQQKRGAQGEQSRTECRFQFGQRFFHMSFSIVRRFESFARTAPHPLAAAMPNRANHPADRINNSYERDS